jgi:hypothetical protein
MMKLRSASSSWPLPNSRPAYAGAVEDEDPVPDDPVGVLAWRTHGAVVQFDLRERLAALEAEIPDDEVPFHRSGI